MKFFLVLALIATVASAAYIKPTLTGEAAQIQEIIAAINSPSTSPATAAALEQMLLDILGAEPVAVGPAMVEQEPISVGPAIIEQEPVSVGPIMIEHEPISVGPAIIDSGVGAPAASSAPLVQIILNINQAAAESSPVAPVAVPEPVDVAAPIEIVDNFPVVAPVSPVQVVDAVPVSPVQVVDVVPVSPVQVVDTAPVAVEPVIIGTPVLPSPAVILPEELN